MNYKLICTDGYTKALSAMSKDEAVRLFLADPEVQAHVAQSHPEMVGKTPEEITAAVAGMVTEETPVAGGEMGGAPTGGTV